MRYHQPFLKPAVPLDVPTGKSSVAARDSFTSWLIRVREKDRKQRTDSYSLEDSELGLCLDLFLIPQDSAQHLKLCEALLIRKSTSLSMVQADVTIVEEFEYLGSTFKILELLNNITSSSVRIRHTCCGY